MKSTRHVSIATLVVGAVLTMVAGSVHATILDLQQAQQANASLINQWDFEGATKATAYLDKKGSLNLTETAGPGSINLIPTDNTSQGIEILDGAGDTGGVRLSTAGLTMPTSMTAEFLVTPYDSVTPAEAGAWSHSTGLGQRFFFLQNNTVLQLIRGETASGANRRDIIGGTSGVTFAEDNAFYVAMALVYADPGGADDATFTIDAYVANLTTRSSLTQVLSGHIAPAVDGGIGAGTGLAMGMLLGPNTTKWSGALDAFALYNTLLAGSTIQQNYEQLLLTPEPSTAVLLGLGALLVCLRKRTRMTE